MAAETGSTREAADARAGPRRGVAGPAHALGPRVVRAVPAFRLRLVDLLDDVVARAERDPASASRSTARWPWSTTTSRSGPRPRPLARARRRAASSRSGPWQVLMDEFLCSGETMSATSSSGWAERGALGGAMPVGYLPDMFGHCAQMPQLLRHAGIEHAFVWRGVPAGRPPRVLVARPGRHRRSAPSTSPTATATPPTSSAAAPHAAPGRPARDPVAAWYAADFLAMYGTDHAAPASDPGAAGGRSRRSRGRAAHPGRHADGYLAEPRHPPRPCASSTGSCAATPAPTSCRACSRCAGSSRRRWPAPSAC